MKNYRVVHNGRSFYITEDKLPFYKNAENCSIYEIIEKPITVAEKSEDTNSTSIYIGRDNNET